MSFSCFILSIDIADIYELILKLKDGAFKRDAGTILWSTWAGTGKPYSIYFRGTTYLQP